MRVLVIGSGGREHAIAYKLSQSSKVSELHFLPGNPGMKKLGKCHNISVTDLDGILACCKENKIDYVVIGPEVPLCLGLADLLEDNGILVFGPKKEAATLEGSKAFSKKFMKQYNIPTAKSVECHNITDALKALKEFSYPLVIKASGLAAGKGVVIVNNEIEAKQTLKEMMIDKTLSDAGDVVVIEEFLQGYECSLLCFLDGETIKPMVYAKDHKQIYDGNKGPNTGGMGTVSPNPFMQNMDQIIEEKILKPVVNAFKVSKMDFRGVLFIGLMIDKDEPKVLEFNVRFGDPETQVILLRLENDLFDVMMKTSLKRLNEVDLKWSNKHAICLVLASEGYPSSYQKGFEIKGLDNVSDDIIIFHAGTKEENGKILTNGGRVLNICCLGDSLSTIREKVYKASEIIDFKGKYYRKDIGLI